MDYDAYDALLHHIFKQTQGDAWFKPTEEHQQVGVSLRVDHGVFRVFPYENPNLEPFEEAVKILNPVVAIKTRSAAIHAALVSVQDDDDHIYIDSNTRIQILESMPFLPRADREQCAAFIRDEGVLVVWSYNLDTIIPMCNDFQEKLISLVWKKRHTLFSSTPSGAGSTTDLSKSDGAVAYSKEVVEEIAEKTARDAPPKSAGFASNVFSYWVSNEKDVEKTAEGPSYRPTRLFGPVYAGFAAGLSLFFIASGISVLIQESVLDGSYTRFALLASAPFLFAVSLFFSLQIVVNLSFMIGPVSQFHQNSKYYSAIPPASNKFVDSNLPHITIELPVYKESLKETIAPSVYSIKKAMQTYARQGGTSAIFVHDDGLQLISEDDRAERIAFYADHNIGWVARPPHSNEPDGFKRAGRFKKASNMNYGLALSLKLEKHLAALEADPGAADERGGACLEDKALELAVEEIFAESGGRWRPWAHNGRSLRVGELILIVDSDTIVPEDCFRDAARELAECPEVAIIQHESDVMQVAHHYFENGIAHFTRRINRCISMGCANGEVAPFVGHNAFLRWAALQDAAFVDAADGVRKIWSEANVSEDFDMALRLQLKGYIIRWATYSKGGFKEGVSLTCDDELNRWQKYSYGCNELLFNPLIEWWHKGPVNKQLHQFVWCGAPVHYKLAMMAYMFSYYGIASAVILSTLNYFLLGWNIAIDGYYEHSFEIWLACTVVFPGAGNVGYTLLEYRLGERDLLSSLIENVTWIPFFFFFFSGLSIHLTQALLAHLFSYNITWGATKKEVERSNFWIEVPRILRRFWLALIISVLLCAAMIIFTTSLVPEGWRVYGWNWAVILPLAINVGSHILFPIVLNPWLMIFSY